MAHAREYQLIERLPTNQGQTRTPGDNVSGIFIKLASSIASFPALHNTTQHIRTKSDPELAITMHIDHGKATLAGGLREETKSVEMSTVQAHVPDSMDIVRERRITIHTELCLNGIQGQGWQDVLVEPDEYPEARGFHVQGVSLVGRI